MILGGSVNHTKIVLIALVCGILGGLIGYALASYIVRIYIEITQPAADVEIRDFRIDAAPYQTLEYKWIWIANVYQRSDRVEYRVKINSENIDLYKACIWVGYFTTTLYAECGYELIFTMDKGKTMGGTFYIYVDYVYLRTRDRQGVISIDVSFRPLP